MPLTYIKHISVALKAVSETLPLPFSEGSRKRLASISPNYFIRREGFP